VKLGITFGFCDLLAEVGHFTCGDAQTETNGFELFTRGVSPSHAEVYLKTVKGRICDFHGIFDRGQSAAFADNRHNWGQDDDVLSDAEGKALLRKLLR